MSLYYDASAFLAPTKGQHGSLKSRVFGTKDLKSPPKQIYALVVETSKWSFILSEVITKSQLLQHERKVRELRVSTTPKAVSVDTFLFS